MSLSAETIARQRGLPHSGAVIIDIEKQFGIELAAAELSPAGKDNRLQVIAWATEDAVKAACQWSDWFSWLDTLKKGRHDDRP
jgi:hypothetical protein